MIQEIWVRRLLAGIIRDVLDELTAEHYDSLTQEPPLTARLGQQLENVRVDLPKGYKLRIITQDLPDRGYGALEHTTGTDLYVGIEVMDGDLRKTKGFLVQAKWDDVGGAAEGSRLAEQCRRMLEISEDAYVWSYGPNGIEVRHARDVLDPEGLDDVELPRDVGDLFNSVFECSEGDKAIGLPAGPRPRRALGDILKRLDAEAGLAFLIHRRRPTWRRKTWSGGRR